MIIQDIIDGLRANKCPFCSKSMKFSFIDEVCSGCLRIESSYDSKHVFGNYFIWEFIWEHNNIKYHLQMMNSELCVIKIHKVLICKIFHSISDNHYNITEQTDLEVLYKIGNQIIKTEVFA